MNKDKVIYKDFDLRFIQHPMTRDISVLTNTEAIKSSIKNIIFSNSFERKFNTKLRGNIRKYLFELNDPLFTNTISMDLVDIITQFEPRVKDVKVNIESDSLLENALTFTISYVCKETEEQINFDVILRGLR